MECTVLNPTFHPPASFPETHCRSRAIELSASPTPPKGSAASAAAAASLYPMSLPTPNPSLPPPPGPSSLYKQNSWSPDSHREEAWLRQKGRRNRRSRSVTDEDLEELKAGIELGFCFDSPEMDQRLSDTFPAYGLYYAVNKHYNDTVSKSAPPPPRSASCSTVPSECGTPSPLGSPHTIFGPGDNPQTVKTRLRQWAQVVAFAVRQSPS